MNAERKWTGLGWRHPLWNLLRFYLSISGKNRQKSWKKNLLAHQEVQINGNQTLPVSSSVVNLLFEYLEERDKLFEIASKKLRDEETALKFCNGNSFLVGRTATQNISHHQSSKAMISCASNIARRVCEENGVTLDDNPQKRCIWCQNNELHVTARNLDGAVPGLVNPFVIWEIKEYWGKTEGGSKMSDAVYECHLVGLELLDYNSRSGHDIRHIVFLDGKTQWGYRKSDMKRFIDLLNQGLIHHLIIGQEVEEIWEPLLRAIIKENRI